MADISQIKLPDGNIHNIVDNTSGYITAESPALTGTPTAPTPLSEASDTQIATVKYVRDSMAGAGAGSVTSVGIANATEGGLSISGSPITGAGTITVGHSNVLASAQTTAGIYPIKIDKNGHISEYGNAVTIPEVPTNVSSFTNDSGYITTQYIEDKTDYEIPVSRVGEIIVGETPIGTDSTNFPTSKAVVDYVDERVTQEIAAIDFEGSITDIKANGTSLPINNGVVNIPAIGPGQSVGLMTDEWMQHIWNRLKSIPTSTSQLTNDSGFITASDIPKNTDEKLAIDLLSQSSTTSATYYPILGKHSNSVGSAARRNYDSEFKYEFINGTTVDLYIGSSKFTGRLNLKKNGIITRLIPSATAQANITLPAITGTIALISDIPTVPTNISSFTNDSGYLTASDIASVMTYKGTKANYAALPSTGNTIGDVWHLTDTGAEWAWDGGAWQELGSTISVDVTETDPVFTASAAAGITSTDISNWNGKVSDTGKWNDVSLAIQQVTNSGDGTYVPLFNSLDAASVSLTPVKKTPTANVIAKYDANSYLYSTTPSANDNSTKVATTAYVDAATIDEKVKQTPLNGVNDSKGFLFSSGIGSNETTNTVYTTDKILWTDYSSLPMMYIYNGSRTKYGTLSYNHLCLANATTTYDGTLRTDGVTANRTYTLPDKTGTIALTSDIPTVPTKTSDLTNDSGYLTMATLPIYDGTVV